MNDTIGRRNGSHNISSAIHHHFSIFYTQRNIISIGLANDLPILSYFLFYKQLQQHGIAKYSADQLFYHLSSIHQLCLPAVYQMQHWLVQKQ